MKLKKLLRSVILPSALLGGVIAPLMLTTSCGVDHSYTLYNNGTYGNSVCSARCDWSDNNEDGHFQPRHKYTFIFTGINNANNQPIHIGYEIFEDFWALSASYTADDSYVQSHPSDYFTISVNSSNKLTIDCKKSTNGNVFMNWSGTYNGNDQSWYGTSDTFAWSNFFFQID
jgi:hypothetical protein